MLKGPGGVSGARFLFVGILNFKAVYSPNALSYRYGVGTPVLTGAGPIR